MFGLFIEKKVKSSRTRIRKKGEMVGSEMGARFGKQHWENFPSRRLCSLSPIMTTRYVAVMRNDKND